MKRRFGGLVAVWVVFFATQLFEMQVGRAGPVQGGLATKRRIEAKQHLVLDKRASSLGEFAKFKGGRRACVIVMGDHDPVVPIVVEVHDDQGKLVARDEPARGTGKANEPGNDVAAAIWYPPRDAYYSITIKNQGSQYNICWIAIK